MGNVLISTSEVPTDFCFTNWNDSWSQLVALLSGQFNRAGTGINFGNQQPPTIDEDKPWFRLNPDGTPDDWYVHTMGFWLAKHPMPPGAVIMYEGTEASIETFDGGESQPVSNVTGPFWEKVTEMNARSPIGPGTLPSTTVIGIGDDLGAEDHTITTAEMPEHSHEIIATNRGTVGGGDGGWIIGEGTDLPANQARNSAAAIQRHGTTEPEGQTTPDEFSLIHPVHAIWFIRRTARLYRRI